MHVQLLTPILLLFSSIGSAASSELFVNPQFNLIIFPVLYLIVHWSKYGWFVEIPSACVLLFCTYNRANVLVETNGHFVSDMETVFNNFFVASLGAWIAAILLELRTCQIIMGEFRKIYSMKEHINNRIFVYLVKVLSLNSVLVMTLFCLDVMRNVSEISDWSLIPYHIGAAGAKTMSTITQGIMNLTKLLYMCRV